MYYSIPQDERNRINRANKYKRQGVSALLAKKFTGHSVKSCMFQSPGNKIQVVLSRSTNTAYYRGLITCGSVWDCPICSAKISARRGQELADGVNIWKGRGGLAVMVTYTIRHNLGDRLDEIARVMTDAIRFVHSGAPYIRIREKYKITGSVSATEVNFNPVNGWHYHKHQLLFIDDKDINTEALEKWLFARYEKYLNLKGYSVVSGVGVKVSPPDSNDVSIYITKWAIQDEITKGNNKDSSSYTPFELLDHPEFYDRFVEYSRTMYGKRRLTWSRGLRDLLGLGVELTDDEIALQQELQEDDVIELALIGREYWGYIVKQGLRSDVLDHAELGSEHFQEWYLHRVIKRFHLNL